MESRFREIRRADELGDASGLTPDYRLKVKKASQIHQDMLRDLQEMRVAFYVQLGAELRHAGCEFHGPGASPAADADDVIPTDPSNPAAWTLDDSAADPEAAGSATQTEPCARRPKLQPRPRRRLRCGSRSTTRTAPDPRSCRSTADPMVPCPATSEPRYARTLGRTRCACSPARKSAPAASPAPCARSTSMKDGRSRFAAIGRRDSCNPDLGFLVDSPNSVHLLHQIVVPLPKDRCVRPNDHLLLTPHVDKGLVQVGVEPDA